MLTDGKISDLFFNYQHDAYDKVFSSRPKDPPTSEEIEEAIKQDANEFAELFPEFGKDAEWYATDFLRRL